MIDHISVAVRDLVIAERFYTAVLTPLGLLKVRDLPDAAIGFGKKVPSTGSTNARRWRGWPTIAACTSACARPMCHQWSFSRSRPERGGASDGDPAVRMHYDEGSATAIPTNKADLRRIDRRTTGFPSADRPHARQFAGFAFYSVLSNVAIAELIANDKIS